MGTTDGYGLTWPSVPLIGQRIGLLYRRAHQLQAQEKAERFHRTPDEAVRHRGKPKQMPQWPGVREEFPQVYNERRPREGLGMQRPRERYRASARSYQGHVRE